MVFWIRWHLPKTGWLNLYPKQTMHYGLLDTSGSQTIASRRIWRGKSLCRQKDGMNCSGLVQKFPQMHPDIRQWMRSNHTIPSAEKICSRSSRRQTNPCWQVPVPSLGVFQMHPIWRPYFFLRHFTKECMLGRQRWCTGLWGMLSCFNRNPPIDHQGRLQPSRQYTQPPLNAERQFSGKGLCGVLSCYILEANQHITQPSKYHATARSTQMAIRHQGV